MGLFKKEDCCICGNKTGLLDKKCSDGKVCKECCGKLSVWFDEFKASSAEDLKAQIAKKDADVAAAASYNFNKIFGEAGVILIDDQKKYFTAFSDTSNGLFGKPRDVKSINDVIDLRPDLIEFGQVVDFEIDITETSREEKKNENGNMVSYDPPHFVYMYMFYLRLRLDHPYIKYVNIQLNKDAVHIPNIGRRQWTDPGRKLAAHLLNLPGLVVEDQAAVYDNFSLLGAVLQSKFTMPDYSYGFKCSLENRDGISRYQYYLMMAREIQNIITEKK